MRKKLSYCLYRVIKYLVWLFSPKIKVTGLENLPDEPAVYVGNHAQMYGPIAAEIHFPVKRYTWCASQMMHLREVPAYAMEDFWWDKPRNIQWFYKLLSYIIAPIAVCVFNNADTIPVYRDMRVRATVEQSVQRLEEGAGLVIFPEWRTPYNHFLYRFQERYVDVAYRYYKKTGKEISFVPIYLAPRLKKMVIGKPIRYDASIPPAKQREKINLYLMEEITRLAEELPLHTVVPYLNMPKKKYPKSRPEVPLV